MKTAINPFTGDLVVIPDVITPGSQVNLGTRKHTRSNIVPINPSVGDTWEELDNGGNYICYWFWNGAYWLSIQTFTKENNLSNVTSINFLFDLPTNYNIYLVEFKSNFLLTATNNSTNYWRIILNRLGASTFALSTLTTLAGNPSTWFSINELLNIHLDTNVANIKALQFTSVKVGTPTNISGSVNTTYRLARI